MYEGKFDSTPVEHDLEWGELVDLLTDHEVAPCTTTSCVGKKCPHKNGIAWSPVIMRDGHRLGKNVEQINAAFFDVDTGEQLAHALTVLDGLSYVLHSTHSYDPAVNQKFRVVVQLSRPLRPEEWHPLWDQFVAMTGLECDKASRDPSRLLFCPVTRADVPPLECEGEGTPLDVDLLLSGVTIGARAATPKRTPPAIDLQVSSAVDMEELRGRLSRATNPLVRKMLAGDDLDALGEVTGTGHDDTMQKLAGALVFNVPHAPDEAFIHLAHIALATPCDGHDDPYEHHLSEFRDMLERARARYLEQNADTLRVDAAIRRYREKKLVARTAGARTAGARPNAVCNNLGTETLHASPELGPRAAGPSSPPMGSVSSGNRVGPVETPGSAAGGHNEARTQGGIARALGTSLAGPLTALLAERASRDEAAEAESGEDEDPDEWLSRLVSKPNKQGVEIATSCPANADLILSESPEWRGQIRFNEVTKNVELGADAPVQCAPASLSVEVSNWLARNQDLQIKASELRPIMAAVARRNSYDPLRDYLVEAAMLWDGKPRAATWLIDYCGAATTDEDGNDLREYVEMMGLKWLLLAGARALDPGCKADNVLILEGAQDLKKSSALEALCGEYFTRSPIVIGQKDGYAVISKQWVVEIQEMNSFLKADDAAAKAFFTTSRDDYRPPYAERPESFPRRCAFAGTINPDGAGYLRDPTGNRRYWPVRIGSSTQIDVERLAEDRDQIWAEVVLRLACGERWWLETAEEKALAAREVAKRVRADPRESIVRAWWARLSPARRTGGWELLDVAREALKTEARDYTPAVQDSVRRALQRMGFAEDRAAATWTAPPDALALPQKVARTMQVIQGAKEAKA